MAGYNHYSMSNNAVQAYNDGLLSASKIAARLKELSPRRFRGIKAADIAEHCRYSEWHHTSAKYNATRFYDLRDVFAVRSKLAKVCAERRGELQFDDGNLFPGIVMFRVEATMGLCKCRRDRTNNNYKRLADGKVFSCRHGYPVSIIEE